MSDLHERVDQSASALDRFIERESRYWSKMAQDIRKGLEKLASHGWYLPPSADWNVPSDLAHSDENLWQQVDAEMSELWSEALTSTEQELEACHPLRTAILRESFVAHRNGQYFLSVLAFLSQADGICLELFGVQLYSKKRNGHIMKLSERITSADPLVVAYLSPLTTIQPIVWSKKTRAGQPNKLNRHAVLHGEDVSYGNKVNSLKALSLLGYVSWALATAKGHSNGGPAVSKKR